MSTIRHASILTTDKTPDTNVVILLTAALKQTLQKKLDEANNASQKRENMQSRLDGRCTILDGLKNHPMEYDDTLIRQTLECVVIEDAEHIKVIFKGGHKAIVELR